MADATLLSNGRYHVMVTAEGTGYSDWQDRAASRWREDAALAGSAAAQVSVDGVESADGWVALVDDASIREVAGSVGREAGSLGPDRPTRNGEQECSSQ